MEDRVTDKFVTSITKSRISDALSKLVSEVHIIQIHFSFLSLCFTKSLIK